MTGDLILHTGSVSGGTMRIYKNRTRLFGYLYSYSRENGYGREMLICTNSDQIESLESLAEALPEMHFHIAAVTEMSARPAVFHKLYAMCDYYLDINYGSEIVSAVKEAFLHNLLILAFVKTQHNRTYTAPEHIFQDAGVMAAAIREAASTPAAMDRHLACQRQAALSEKESAYQDLFVSDAAEEPEAD